MHTNYSQADELETLKYLSPWNETLNNYPFKFELSWPVSLPIQLVRGFKKGSKRHHGLDLDGHTGDLIYAAHPGRVVYANSKIRGYGNLVIIEYKGQWSTYYAHLSVMNVREGDRVSRHQVIGKMGKTGNATGSHLHFELRRNGDAIDPMPFLELYTGSIR